MEKLPVCGNSEKRVFAWYRLVTSLCEPRLATWPDNIPCHVQGICRIRIRHDHAFTVYQKYFLVRKIPSSVRKIPGP